MPGCWPMRDSLLKLQYVSVDSTIQSTFIVKNSPAGYWNIQHSFTILTDVNFTEKASMFTIFCTIPRCDRHVSSFTSKYTTVISRFAVFLFCCCYIFVHDFWMDGRSQTCFNCATFLICTSGVKSCNPVLVVGCCLLSFLVLIIYSKNQTADCLDSISSICPNRSFFIA